MAVSLDNYIRKMRAYAYVYAYIYMCVCICMCKCMYMYVGLSWDCDRLSCVPNTSANRCLSICCVEYMLQVLNRFCKIRVLNMLALMFMLMWLCSCCYVVCSCLNGFYVLHILNRFCGETCASSIWVWMKSIFVMLQLRCVSVSVSVHACMHIYICTCAYVCVQ